MSKRKISDLVPIKYTFVGLENKGTECFIHSVIQCLFHLEPIQTYFSKWKINFIPGPDQPGRFTYLFYKIYTNYISDDSNSIELYEMMDEFKFMCRTKMNSLFHEEEDASECLNVIIDTIYEELKHFKTENVIEHFSGSSSITIECNKCDYKNQLNESFNVFSVMISEPKSVPNTHLPIRVFHIKHHKHVSDLNYKEKIFFMKPLHDDFEKDFVVLGKTDEFKRTIIQTYGENVDIFCRLRLQDNCNCSIRKLQEMKETIPLSNIEECYIVEKNPKHSLCLFIVVGDIKYFQPIFIHVENYENLTILNEMNRYFNRPLLDVYLKFLVVRRDSIVFNSKCLTQFEQKQHYFHIENDWLDYFFLRSENRFKEKLNIPPTVQQCVDESLKSNEYDSNWKCSFCQVCQVPKCHRRIKKLPNILFVQLIRFTGSMEKIETLVNCHIDKPLTIQDSKYKIIGIISHSGSMNRGHYISYVRGENDKDEPWIKCDDKNVEVVGKVDVSNAYILIYRKL
jgi:ubiquitin C-terminal hydrolase